MRIEITFNNGLSSICTGDYLTLSPGTCELEVLRVVGKSLKYKLNDVHRLIVVGNPAVREDDD